MSRNVMVEGALVTRAETSSSSTSPARRRRGGTWIPFLFLAPFLLLYTVVYLIPTLYSIGQSLFSQQSSGLGIAPPETVFVGIGNYVKALGSSDLWTAFGNVLIFGVIQVPLMLVFALLLALALDSIASRGRGVFRLIYFLPYAIPGVVAALLWGYLYQPQLSPITAALAPLGIHLDFLGPNLVVLSMTNIVTWAWTGYNTLLMLSALQSLPRELFEAARIDGASEWRIAFAIKVPLIRGMVLLSTILSIIGTIQLFNEPQVIRTITSTVSANYSPIMLTFTAAFRSGNTGYAAALSVVIAVVAGVLAIGFYYGVRRRQS